MRKTYRILGTFLFLLAGSLTATYAQTTGGEQFQQAAGDYSRLYSGEVEEMYSPKLYRNKPYFRSEDFTTGALTYRGRRYTGVTMWLDLFRDRLIVASPGTRTGMYFAPEYLGEVTLHNATFIYLKKGNAQCLSEGYYQLIASGEGFQVLARKVFLERTESKIYMVDEEIVDKRTKFFDYYYRYYLVRDGKTVLLKRPSHFIKCFPTIKSELKEYARKQKLKMRKEAAADHALQLLAERADQLLTEGRR